MFVSIVGIFCSSKSLCFLTFPSSALLFLVCASLSTSDFYNAKMSSCLCLSSDSSAPNVFFLGLLLGDLDLITRGEDMKYSHQSSEYFMLFEELLKSAAELDKRLLVEYVA